MNFKFFCRIELKFFDNLIISFCICDAIWETIHKVGKCDFEISMAPHGGETEEYSENKKLPQKLNSAAKYGVPKVKVAKS